MAIIAAGDFANSSYSIECPSSRLLSPCLRFYFMGPLRASASYLSIYPRPRTGYATSYLILLGTAEARSVNNVKNTHTHTINASGIE